MEKPRHNPLTLADLQAALTGLATKDDLKGLATQETVTTIMETVAELKESMTVVKETMHELLEGQTAMHEDVRYLRRSVDMLTRSDAAHEAAIASLRKRVERVERKVGITK
jgi:uncharacterized protein YoxC